MDKVLASYETIDKLSDDELRAHSARLRQHMIDVEAPFENRIAEIKAKLDAEGIEYPKSAKKEELLALLEADLYDDEEE